MDITLFAVVLIAIVAAAFWLRDQLCAQQACRARVFLTLHSRETEDVLGSPAPCSTAHLYKDLSLPSVPQPGVELDGLGTGPVAIARAVMEEGAKHQVFLQLLPLRVPATEIESVVSALVGDMGWTRTELDPPYPAGMPNNSFKGMPLRAAPLNS